MWISASLKPVISPFMATIIAIISVFAGWANDTI
jgi:hypothetical protein